MTMMSLSLYQVAVKVVFVTTMIVSTGQGLLQGQGIEEVRESYEETLEERTSLMQKMSDLESDYRAILQDIDRLKQQPDTLQNRVALRDLLRESRTLADQLRDLQKELRSKEDRLKQQRARLVRALDSEIRTLESQLAGATSYERGQIVAELNDLRSQRDRYTRPLPNAPSDRAVTETLEMASELEGASPEDLLAAADELKDTEDQVRKRLEAVETRLDELRDAKMLARRASNFEAEEQFFDETDRSQFVGQYDGTTQSAGGGGNGLFAGGDGQDTAGAPESPDGAAGEERNQNDDFNTGSDPGTVADGAGGQDQPPADQDSGGGAEGGDDVFDQQDSLRLDSGVDPETMSGSGFQSDFEIDSRIDRLESEQERLEKQAETLESKAEQLRRRAEDSLE
jgi:predicted  nucleic acid-binding Zn-ribbon protein